MTEMPKETFWEEECRMLEYGLDGAGSCGGGERDGILTVTQLNMLAQGVIDSNPLLGKVAIRG